MKRIRHSEQYFSIDYDANAAYYNAKSEGTDIYARNFATQMRFRSPELNTFIDSFAIDLVKPETMTHCDTEDGIIYEVSFSAKGCIEGTDLYTCKISKMSVTVRQEAPEALKITVSNIILPWVLLEKRPNEPEKKPSGIASKLRSLFRK